MVNLRLDLTPWMNLIDRIKGNVKLNKVKLMMEIGDVAIDSMRREIPRGKLWDSIGNPSANGVYNLITSADNLLLQVGSDLEYAAYVNRGIRHYYTIQPKNTKAMRFHWDKLDRVAYFKKVKHPPVRGKFFVEYGAIQVNKYMGKVAGRMFL